MSSGSATYLVSQEDTITKYKRNFVNLHGTTAA